ncbi:MAG: type II toxin-antitoxin system death-on-curing family toxin [Puniceicoccaceae bacterium]
MKDPYWLSAESLLAVHKELLARFGGLEGVRDKGMLDSALNRPLQLHHYGDPSLFELAAAYTNGLVNNHPFLDGNKRIGFMAAYMFLGINGYRLKAPETEAVIMTRDLAAGETVEAAYAEWLQRSSEKR